MEAANTGTSAGLVIIYLLSFFNLAVTIVRLDVVIRFAKLTNIFEAAAKRIEYAYWGVIEVMTVIMCANLPAMSAFLRFVGHDQKSSPSTSASTQHHSSPSSSSSSAANVLRLWFNKSLHTLRVATNSGSRRSSGSDSEERSTTIDFHEKKDASDFAEMTYMSSPVKGGRTDTDKANVVKTTTAYNSRSDFELPKQGMITKAQRSAAPALASARGGQDGIYRTDEVEVESSLV